MLDFITKGLEFFVGSKSKKDLKELTPYVAKVNAEFAKLSSISDDQLRGKTQELKNKIAEGLKGLRDEIKALKEKAENGEGLDIHQKEQIYDQVDKLEKQDDEKLEEILLEILPEAFAVVKETARRLTENKKLEVTATDLDRTIAAKVANVEINDGKATWHNKWLASGVEVEWNMVHYDVQLIGGLVLHQGKIAEMATGEGKTLVATLPAYLNAIGGKGVHVVTVNDYLAKRDCEWMAPLFQFHGLTIDCIDKYQPHSEERVAAYQADITYGTNNEFGFDYLRDNMSRNVSELVQKKHHFAMVDEVDSVLIDEARTPLIISGPIPKGDEHEFGELKPYIAKVYEEQRKLANQYLTDAKKFFKEGNEKEGGLPLFRAHRALPKNKALIKFLSEPGVRQVLQKTENVYIAENNKLMPEADAPLFFTIDEKTNSVELTDKGHEYVTNLGNDSDFFVLPDISIELDAIEKATDLSVEEKANKKDHLLNEYSSKSQRIHSVNQLLKAYTLFEKDTEYIVVDGKVKIVDEQTGRVMDGRRYSDGLHQSIEAKENVKVEDATQTYATVTLQNYFRMYHKLCGMTGTAETEAGEFWEIYELDVVVVPTNRVIQRDDQQDKVFKTVREKFNAAIDETVELSKSGRPVLIGTTSVEISEVMSRMLTMRKIPHQVLNAKQHAKEADIVAKAGLPGTVTIATNMAGRGTDIKLSPESKAAGGLAIIGTERHESRRVDRQLRGRAGRQGDVGSSLFYVSLEDNLMRLFGSERISKLMDRFGFEEGEVIEHSMITKSIERAQKKVEENNFGMRKRLLEYDDVMNSQREVIYTRRRNALYGERLELDILNSIYEMADQTVAQYKIDKNFTGFNMEVISVFGMTTTITEQEFQSTKNETLVEKLFNEAEAHYNDKLERISHKLMPFMRNIFNDRGAVIENVVVPIQEGNKQIQIPVTLREFVETEGKNLKAHLEKFAGLAFIDAAWKDHLREMDDLKQNAQNASYEQKDPLLIYKFSAFDLFKQLLGTINKDIVQFLLRGEIAVDNEKEVQEAREPRTINRGSEVKQDSGSVLSGDAQRAAAQNANQEEAEPIQPLQSEKLYGRNDRVTVQYEDGSVKEEVKFKSVEHDVKTGRAVVLEED